MRDREAAGAPPLDVGVEPHELRGPFARRRRVVLVRLAAPRRTRLEDEGNAGLGTRSASAGDGAAEPDLARQEAGRPELQRGRPGILSVARLRMRN